MKIVAFKHETPAAEHLPVESVLPENVTPAAEPPSAAIPAPPALPPAHPLHLFLRACFYVPYMPVRASCLYLYRHPIHGILNIFLLGVIALLILTGSQIHNQLILSKISNQIIDQIIRESRFTRTYDAGTIAVSGGYEFQRVGGPEWMQRESVRAILYFSRKAGLPVEDQAALLAIADIESGFNPFARAGTTTACGLFQFVKKTGETFGLTHANCMDPWKNAKAAVDHYISNFEKRVRPQVAGLKGAERAFRAFELSYYLHHDGPVSSNPSNEVKAIVLSGSQFLFKAFHALSDERESQWRAPSFAERFSDNLWKVVGVLERFLGQDDLPFLRRFTSAPSPAEDSQPRVTGEANGPG